MTRRDLRPRSLHGTGLTRTEMREAFLDPAPIECMGCEEAEGERLEQRDALSATAPWRPVALCVPCRARRTSVGVVIIRSFGGP